MEQNGCVYKNKQNLLIKGSSTVNYAAFNVSTPGTDNIISMNIYHRVRYCKPFIKKLKWTYAST